MICFFTMASNARSGVNSPVLRTHRTDKTAGHKRTETNSEEKKKQQKCLKNNSKTDIRDNDINTEVKPREIRILEGAVEGKKRIKTTF